MSDARKAHAAPPGAARLLAVWHTAECWLAVTCFAFIAIILVLDVLGREFLAPILNFLDIDAGPTGIFASQRMSIYALVLGSFAGIGIATATGSHLVPRVGFGWVPKAWGPAMDRLADLLTGCFLLGFTWYGFKFVHSSYVVDLRAPVLDWSVWPFQLAIPLGFLSAACRYFAYALWPTLRPGLPEFQE
ncbi:MAG: TRAP transporter small permease [Alphaproteobacteria bacterium]|nr:TRAP transporter small permease [Alphaproteobacteria bacterium]